MQFCLKDNITQKLWECQQTRHNSYVNLLFVAKYLSKCLEITKISQAFQSLNVFVPLIYNVHKEKSMF